MFHFTGKKPFFFFFFVYASLYPLIKTTCRHKITVSLNVALENVVVFIIMFLRNFTFWHSCHFLFPLISLFVSVCWHLWKCNNDGDLRSVFDTDVTWCSPALSRRRLSEWANSRKRFCATLRDMKHANMLLLKMHKLEEYDYSSSNNNNNNKKTNPKQLVCIYLLIYSFLYSNLGVYLGLIVYCLVMVFIHCL